MEPLHGIAAHRAPERLLELARHVLALLRQRGHIVRGLARQNLLRRLARERRAPEEAEIGDRAERIEIGALIDLLAEQLFRRGKLRRAAARGGAAEAGAAAERECESEVRDA